MGRNFGVLLLLFFSYVSVAQNCLENIYASSKLLNSGNADGCLELIRTCASENTPESIRWQVHRLQAMAYIYKVQSDSAIMAAQKMLDIYPTYTPDYRNDPAEFISLLKKIVVIPTFSLGLAVSAGTNTTFPVVDKGYIVADYRKTYYSQSAIQFGTNVGFHLSPQLMLEAGLYSTIKKYKIDYAFTDWKVNYQEKLTYLDIPIVARYIIRPSQKFRPYVLGGYYNGYLMYDLNNLQSEYTPTGQINEINRLDALGRRNRFNPGWTVGTGFYYKLKKGHLNVQANYYHSLRKINDPEKRFGYSEQLYTYFYVDDDVRLHNLVLSVGSTFYMNYRVYHKKQSK